MFEENLGLYTATPCLESLGSASCSCFPSIFPFGMSLLSMLSCFLRQDPVCKQGQEESMAPLELAFWQPVTQQAWPHPLLIVDSYVQRNRLAMTISLPSIRPFSGQDREARQWLTSWQKTAQSPGLQENGMKQGASRGSILSPYLTPPHPNTFPPALSIPTPVCCIAHLLPCPLSLKPAPLHHMLQPHGRRIFSYM